MVSDDCTRFAVSLSVFLFFSGHPNVTVAPNCDSDSELPVLQRPDPPTHLSLLSQSMMDQEVCFCVIEIFIFSF